ncbi:hypothetical protein M2135_000690 [Parabacteroides sp. PF5-9]|nr:hypothetical protein [Parabacteroides sp. PF5-9]
MELQINNKTKLVKYFIKALKTPTRTFNSKYHFVNRQQNKANCHFTPFDIHLFGRSYRSVRKKRTDLGLIFE